MNQQDGTNNQGSAKVSAGTKVAYIGTGVLIGLIIYPFVRKTLAKVQPKVDAIFDDLTGKAEDMFERTSDLMAKARARASKDDHDEAAKHGKDNSKVL